MSLSANPVAGGGKPEGDTCTFLATVRVEDFLSQPAGEQLYADIGFVAHLHYCMSRLSKTRQTEFVRFQVEDSQQLIFGRSLEGRNDLPSLQLFHVSCAQLRGLRAALREARLKLMQRKATA